MATKHLILAYIISFLIIIANEGIDHIIKNISNEVYLLLYICTTPYFIIKAKEDSIKAIINKVEMGLKVRNKEETKNIIDFYNMKLNLFEKYNDANKKYKEIRNIVDYVCKEEQEEEINMHNINEELDAYLSYRLHSMNIEYSLENQAKESDNKIFTNTSYKII
jgi:hypothetical protein